MKRFAPLLCSVTVLLLHAAPTLAQKAILSFEPGGIAACSKAIHQPIPSAPDNPRSFNYACDERDLEIEKAMFADLNRSMATHSTEEQKAFADLIQSFTRFRTLQLDIDMKVCGAGNGCGEILESAKVRLNFDFLKMANGFDKDDSPSFSAADFAKEDASLNSTYANLIKVNFPGTTWGEDDCTSEPQPCPSIKEFRQAERAWLRYRDAWVTFGPMRWPQINAVSWRTYLTRQRTRQLQDSF
jgi:uncharacterized protein YecT (DUF1311 family)